MDQKIYSKNIDVAQLARALQSHFATQGYETQALGTSPNMLVQVRKKGVIRAVTGRQRAMTAQFRDASEGVVVTLGEQTWGDKAAVGAVAALFGRPLFVASAAYGAYKQSKLPEQFWQIIDSIAIPTSKSFPTPQPVERSQNSQIPKFCPDCGTPQQETDFCPKCGRKHIEAK